MSDEIPICLVTGHTGFIGHNLMEELQRLGFKAVGLESMRGEAIDLCDASMVTEAVDRIRPDIIFHLGGVSGPMQFENEPSTVVRVNIEGTQTLLSAAQRFGTRRVICAGSVAGYATAGSFGPEPDSIYGLTKRVAEFQTSLWARQTGREATVLRIGSVYGLGRASDNPIHQMVQEALLKRVITYAPHVMEPCIEIRTCVALIAALAQVKTLRPRYDVVTDRPQAGDVAAIIAKLTGARLFSDTVPNIEAGNFPYEFDPEPLFQDTAQGHAVTLREGIESLVTAWRQ
ncbi:NAD-dependent epimerase/dehydratase family protein [Vreelandella populi]|nr:NAD(P)-dependent oxidoreductase [Halomonas populi]